MEKTHPLRDPVAVNHLPGRESGEALRSGGIDAEAFADDGLQVGKLLGGGGVDFAFELVAGADLGKEFGVCCCGAVFEEVVCCCCEEGCYCFSSCYPVVLVSLAGSTWD